MQTQQYLSFADECKYKWVQKKYRMYVLGFRIKKIKGGQFYPGTGTIAYSILRREVKVKMIHFLGPRGPYVLP